MGGSIFWGSTIKAKRVPLREKVPFLEPEVIAPSVPLLLPAPQPPPVVDTWRRVSEAYPVFFAER